MPAGGTTGQLLAKSSATDYATQWIAPPTPGAPTANPIFTGNVFMQMGSHTVKSAAATLTAAELLTRYILYSGAAATLTMPTGTLIDTALTAALGSALPNDRAFEFTIGNSGTGTATLGGATGLTLAGPMGVTTGTSATFRVRKVAANTFTVYRA